MKAIHDEIIIGSDEAGKGEWLGPLCVAAVALTEKQSAYLATQGVMDSKELKRNRILELAGIIKNNCVFHYIVTITPIRFNELLREVKNEGKSLNDMLAWAHATAIRNVYKSLADWSKINVKVIIDEFDKIKTEARLKRVINLLKIQLEQKPRAEQEIAVAAASILAKGSREEWIDRESQKLNLELRKFSSIDALSHKNANYFAKISYLRHR